MTADASQARPSRLARFAGVGVLFVLSALVGVAAAQVSGGVMGLAAKAMGRTTGIDGWVTASMVATAQVVGTAVFFVLVRLFRKGSTRDYVHVVLTAVLLAIGLTVFRTLASLREPPVRAERPITRPLVEVEPVRMETTAMNVRGFGTVQPRIEVSVVPQVAGRVVACHPNFVDGGFFKANEPLITIEKRDYELAVQNAASAVAAAEVALAREQAEALVARQEWEQLHPGTEPPSKLVLREPQVKQAQAQLQAAEAQYSKALLDLQRTEVILPFNGRIWQKTVDVGQYVAPGQVVARVYGTDVVEIVVPLEDRELQWFDIPEVQPSNTGGSGDGTTSSAGPVAVLRTKFAGREYTWRGHVVRTEGRIDETARTVAVVVEVRDPFAAEDGRPPLVPGMFIREVEIQGRTVSGIVRIPRHALRKGQYVWVAEDGRLRIREVTIARRDEQFVYVSQGLADGDRVITTALDAVSDGMEIRVDGEVVAGGATAGSAPGSAGRSQAGEEQ